MNFKEILPENLDRNAIRLIGHEYMLITAGNIDHCNTMTAAWGGLGFLWHKPVAFIFIRPQRYTFQFTEKNNYFTLCFFPEKYREILEFCGSCSGRDTNKIQETGLRPIGYENKAVYFEQAEIVLICRKLYYHDINPSQFTDKNIEKVYPLKDYHRMYVGEIEKVLVKDNEK